MDTDDPDYILILITDDADPLLLSCRLLFVLSEVWSLDMIRIEPQSRCSCSFENMNQTFKFPLPRC